MATLTQSAAPLNLSIVEGSPFSVLLNITATDSSNNPIAWSQLTNFVVAMTNPFRECSAAEPTITFPNSGQALLSWSATETAAIPDSSTSWSLSCTISGTGPVALVGGKISVSSSTSPGTGSSTSANLAISVGTNTVTLSVSTGAPGFSLYVNPVPYGAVGNGTHDDTAAIQAALNYAATVPNSIVALPAPQAGGCWRITAPLIIPPQTTLQSTIESYPVPFYSGSGFVAPDNYIYVDSAFSGAAAIILAGAADSSSAWSLTSKSQCVKDTYISFGTGANAPSGTVDGVQILGTVRSWTLSNVGVMGATGTGFNGVQSSNDLGYPISGRIYRCVSLNAGKYGFKTGQLNSSNTYMNGMTDTYMTDCWASNSALDGFYIGGMGNSTIDNCRSEWNLGNGFRFSTASNFSGMVVGTLSTDNNSQNGVFVTTDGLAGVSPLLFDSLYLRRDGRNAPLRTTDPGTGGGAYAGFTVSGQTGVSMPPITVDSLVVAPGVGQDGVTAVATTLSTSPTSGSSTFGVSSATGIPTNSGTYSGSLALNSGTVSITIQTGLSFTTSQYLTIYHDNSNYMAGTVTSYNSSTGALVMNVTRVVGTTLGASLSSWTIGMMLYLTSSTTLGTDSAQTNEFVMVASASGTTITTLNPLTYGYNGNGSVTNGSANSPQRGLNILKGGIVNINGGHVGGDAIGFRDAGSSTAVRRGPNISEATGLWSAPSAVTPGFYASASGSAHLAGATLTGALAMGANKITGLVNGTASTDAAAYGQLALYSTAMVTASGAYSGTVPTWATTVEVRAVGGGGAGGGGALSTTGFGDGGGGAAGTVVAGIFPVTGGESYSGSVGAGVTATGAGSSGSQGSNTTFTTATAGTVTAAGGSGGTAGTSTTHGGGGVYGTSGNVAATGGMLGAGNGGINGAGRLSPGPMAFGSSGGSSGKEQSGSVGGNGGNGGNSATGATSPSASATTSGGAGAQGQDSSTTTPGGGGGGGGGAAFTGGTAGGGGKGGIGSVYLIFRAE